MRHSAIVVGALLFFFSATASAQPLPSNAAAAETLFNEAEGLVQTEHFAQACAKFGESQRLDPQLGTLLHLADCYERNGQAASAWVTFREAAELAARKLDSREQVAKERAEALAPKLSTLTILVPKDSEVGGLEVEQDGQPIRAAMWGAAVPIDAGTYRLAARATNREPWTREVRVKESDRIVVTVPLLAPRALPVIAPASAETPKAEPEEPARVRTIGWILAGAGVVGLVGGGAFAAVASSKGNDADSICPKGSGCTRDEVMRYDDAYSGAESAATVSRVALSIGGTLLVVGAILVLVAPTSRHAWARPPARQSASGSSTRWALSW